VPPWFHVRVMGPFALAGVQLLVPRRKVRASSLPVFLTYIVWVMVPPAVKVPQSMALRGVVQALLEYTPKLADLDTLPLGEGILDAPTAAKVVSDRANAIITNAITVAVMESFIFGVFFPADYRVYRVLINIANYDPHNAPKQHIYIR
jgi:hypothetical protein